MAAPSTPTPLAVTGDDDADRLLRDDPLALVIGMLLDQQIPMEWAFIGPHRLTERLHASLDARALASMDTDELIEAFRETPAIHRFPKSMAERVQQMCQHVVDEHDGDVTRVWTGASSGRDLFQRLQAMPGFGKEKSRIFVAVLAKRFGIQPEGWQDVVGAFADDEPRSVADIDGPEALAAVREYKKLQKAQGRKKDE